MATNGYIDWSGQWCMCVVSSEGWATKPFQNSLIWYISRSGLAFLPMHYSGYGCKWRRKFCTIALEQQRSLEQAGTKVEICGGASETFFAQMVLVLLDLPSGYIFAVRSPNFEG